MTSLNTSKPQQHQAVACPPGALPGLIAGLSGLEFTLLAGENAVGFFQGFLGPDVVPEPRHFPCIDWRLWVKPLDQSARLVRVVSFGDVFANLRDRRPGIV